MKLIYLTSKIYPSRTANSLQTLYMANAFGEIMRDDFIFIVSKSDSGNLSNKGKVHETEYIKSHFRSLYYFFWFPIFFKKRFAKINDNVVIYCRDFYLAMTAIFFKKIFGYKIAFEYHDPPFGGWRDSLITRFCDYILPTTQAMQEYLIERYNTSKDKFLVSPNGVDVSEFLISDTKEECREKTGLPKDKKIVLYSGHLYLKKGAHTLLAAARSLGDVLFVFVGGTENDLDEFRESASGLDNVLIVGYKRHNEIPFWLKSADILIAPQSAKDEAARRWACPIKIFEYMASGTPMIVSDIPSIREILSEKNAYFVRPDDAGELIGKISNVLLDYDRAKIRGLRAREHAENYTWENRAGKILKFISQA